MKKLLLAIAICLLIAGNACATEPINLGDIPDLNQAVIYSCDQGKVRYASSLTLITLWNEKIDIDALYISKSEFGAAASIELIDLGDIVKFSILKYVSFEPFVYIAFDNIGSGNTVETDYGFGAKLLSLEF